MNWKVGITLLAGGVMGLQGGVWSDPIHEAVISGRVSQVKALLKSRPSLVNARSAYGWRPLHWAAAYGTREMVAFLLARGALVNAKDPTGMAPLHLAAGKDPEIVRMLLDRGANVNLQDQDGWTPLHYAALYGQTTAAHLLLDRGAHLNVKGLDVASKALGVEQHDRNTKTPLDIAIDEGYPQVEKLLSQHGGHRGNMGTGD